MLEIMKKMLNTMNKIEVNGKENLDMLLGCMMTVEQIINALEGDENANDNDE